MLQQPIKLRGGMPRHRKHSPGPGKLRRVFSYFLLRVALDETGHLEGGGEYGALELQPVEQAVEVDIVGCYACGDNADDTLMGAAFPQGEAYFAGVDVLAGHGFITLTEYDVYDVIGCSGFAAEVVDDIRMVEFSACVGEEEAFLGCCGGG